MPPRLLPFREDKRKLETVGFTEISQRGSHVKFANQPEQGLRTTVGPRHREVAAGTPRSILRPTGLNRDEFEGL